LDYKKVNKNDLDKPDLDSPPGKSDISDPFPPPPAGDMSQAQDEGGPLIPQRGRPPSGNNRRIAPIEPPPLDDPF
jgi:hypothetical protein